MVYLLPTVSAMIIKSLHIVIDAVFVGNGLGAASGRSRSLHHSWLSLAPSGWRLGLAGPH